MPVTALVSVSNKKGECKWGSLQEFVHHEDSCENFGSSVIPTDEVHKIGILDIRLVNQDRHFANILCRYDDAGKLRLTPIDHGAVLPSCFHLDKARFEWMYWKQAKHPFAEVTLAHIASLDPKLDADFLRSMDVEEECVGTSDEVAPTGRKARAFAVGHWKYDSTRPFRRRPTQSMGASHLRPPWCVSDKRRHFEHIR